MIFNKLNIFIMVASLFVRPMFTLCTMEMYYYQTTSYTIGNKSDGTITNETISTRTAQVTDSYLQELSATIESVNPLNNLTGNLLNDLVAQAPSQHPELKLKPTPFSFKDAGGDFLPSSGFNSFNESQRKAEGAFCRRSFDGRSGYCVLAYQCLHVVYEYREHGTKIDTCTYRKNIPVVCCPLADKQNEEQRISARKCQEYHDAVQDIILNLPRTFSGKMCVSSLPLIVGGRVTRSEEYPHMSALGWIQSDGELKWGCGGTLISDQFILTAAHCATADVKAPDIVRLGTKNLSGSMTNQQDIKILMIFLHPKYISASHYHDIALIKLTKRVRFSTHVQPACLWQLPDVSMQTVVATGWGRTEFSGNKTDELQKVDLNIIDPEKCKRTYLKERRLPQGITEKLFCAGHMEGGKDTCQGDSGGPLHAELPEFNCVKFVVGITSFGKFCAAPNMPGVYTKIYSYLDWIEKIVFKL